MPPRPAGVAVTYRTCCCTSTWGGARSGELHPLRPTQGSGLLAVLAGWDCHHEPLRSRVGREGVCREHRVQPPSQLPSVRRAGMWRPASSEGIGIHRARRVGGST